MKIKSFKCIPIHYTLDEIFRAGTYQVKKPLHYRRSR